MDRIDLIALNGNIGLHYEWKINNATYRLNPNGRYALYKDDKGRWKESASVTNNDLMGEE